MKTYWFMDESGIIYQIYEDENILFCHDFKYGFEIHGDTLVCYIPPSLTEHKYQLYNSLAELSATFGE